MKKEWLNNISRDVLALGSVVFYILVVGRALIQPYTLFLIELSTAALVLFLLHLFSKKYDSYSARALILTVTTSIFYESVVFALFVSAVFVLVVLSSFNIGDSSERTFLKAKIIRGVLYGIISLIPALGLSFYLSSKYGLSNY